MKWQSWDQKLPGLYLLLIDFFYFLAPLQAGVEESVSFDSQGSRPQLGSLPWKRKPSLTIPLHENEILMDILKQVTRKEMNTCHILAAPHPHPYLKFYLYVSLHGNQLGYRVITQMQP